MAWEDKVWETVRGRTQMARRSVEDVARIVGEKAFVQAADRRGFHVARIGKQYVVFRNPIDVKC